MWTRNLSRMPIFTHEQLEEHLIGSNSTIDKKPKAASRHKKLGYQLFKCGYVSVVLVRPNVQMGEQCNFLVRGKINAEMKKNDYTVYVHLKCGSGKVVHASCECPAGKGGCCKHVAALLFQLLDYIELELTEVPVQLSCTEKLQSWNVPGLHPEKRGAVLFEDLLFEQANYQKDKLGRKRPIVKGKRDGFIAAPAFSEKVKKADLERLRNSLDDDCPLAYLLDDHNCEPFDYESYCQNLPSRIKLEKKKKVLLHLNTEEVRTNILKQLDETCDPLITLSPDQIETVKKVNVSKAESLEIERNTRGQADCPEWYQHREKRLTASNFGAVINRRETIFPKTILEKINSSSACNQRIPLSCRWGKENEENALLQYYESLDTQVKVCECVGLVVNPKWPWLGASPDAFASCSQEASPYGAVEIKCPSSKISMTIAEACQDKNFYLNYVNGQVGLKQKHPYYYQLQGIMAICQLQWIDFVVYTVADLHVQRVYFDSHNWKENMLPKLTKFYFEFLA